jgi:hypothetical protein
MHIERSSRHGSVVGSFGEHLVRNWLSRSGFETSIVDHTGADLVAYSKALNQRLAISVKSRTRVRGTESESVKMFIRQGDREKLLAACEFFNGEAWLAIYVECETVGDLFLTSLKNYDQKYCSRRENVRGAYWAMTPGALLRYRNDPEVKHLRVEFTTENWWSVLAQLHRQKDEDEDEDGGREPNL